MSPGGVGSSGGNKKPRWSALRDVGCTQTRRPSTPCRTAGLPKHTIIKSSRNQRYHVKHHGRPQGAGRGGRRPAGGWTSASTEKKSCSRAQRTQSPARTEPRRSTRPQRAAVGAAGTGPRPPAPPPASHPQEPTPLRRRPKTRATAGQWKMAPGAPHPVPRAG
ncbi:hypothetical protein INR49_021230, partial [Caranx melampygus]